MNAGWEPRLVCPGCGMHYPSDYSLRMHREGQTLHLADLRVRLTNDIWTRLSADSLDVDAVVVEACVDEAMFTIEHLMPCALEAAT